MAEHHEISVRGTPIHMLQDGARPPLLFLHGSGGDGLRDALDPRQRHATNTQGADRA